MDLGFRVPRPERLAAIRIGLYGSGHPESRGELVEQANVRLTQEEHDVLQAVIFVREVAGSSEVLRPLVVDFLAQQREHEEVRLALRGRATSRAKRVGKVRELRPRVATKKPSR